MAYKDILVHVDDERGSARRLRLAVELAGAHGAHLTGFYRVPEVDPNEYLRPTIRPERIDTLQKRIAAAAQAAQGAFEQATASEAVSSEWHSTSAQFATTVLEGSQYADLVVAGQSDPRSEHRSRLAETFVLSTGRPTLVVPYVEGATAVGKRVLVAWNETREATRAVHDALPLLERAERVDVLSVERHHSDAAAGASMALCQHLARHGVNAQAHHVAEAELGVADVLLSRASDLGTDLIVMGAYGHSRLRELVLGGATREVLEEMTVPVLMSH